MDEDDIELNDDENSGGEEGDEGVEELNDDVAMSVFGSDQAAAMRQQYDRVATEQQNFFNTVIQPLNAQMAATETLGDVAAPSAPAGDDPDKVVPNSQYDAPMLRPATGVPTPTAAYGQLALGPPPSPTNIYQGVNSSFASSPSQTAVAESAGSVVVDINGGNDGAGQTVAKRSLGFTAGLVGGGLLAGLASGATATYFIYTQLFSSAGAVNGTDGVGPSSTIRVGDPLNFGTVKTGTTKALTLTISNAGPLPIAVSAITLPSGFAASWTGSIPAGKSQDVPVTFAPSEGQVYAGNVVVTSDAKFGSNTTSVSGLGLVPGAAPSPAIGVAGFLDFGPVPDGQTRFSGLTIHNSGSAPLTVTGITAPEGFTAAWSGTLAPGAFTVVQVIFTPTAVQSYGGSLVVASDATSGAGSLNVSGAGVATTGDPDKDLASLADSLVLQWNEQLDEASFWNAVASWATTATGTPPLAPSYKVQLMVLLYAYALATHYMPPILPAPADVESLVNALKRQRDAGEWDNQTLYQRAGNLVSPSSGLALYRYEKLNILARVIGLIIQSAPPQVRGAAPKPDGSHA